MTLLPSKIMLSNLAPLCVCVFDWCTMCEHALTLEGCGVSIFTCFTKFINGIFLNTLCVWNFIIYIILCQGEKNTLILYIDDRNTTYVYASKGTLVAYFNLSLQYCQSVY